MFGIRLSRHAKEQCDARGIASTEEVEAAVKKAAAKIGKSNTWEVRVVVKQFSNKVSLPDGSNGNLVIACVDPQSGTVKTVMLQRESQTRRKNDADVIW